LGGLTGEVELVERLAQQLRLGVDVAVRPLTGSRLTRHVAAVTAAGLRTPPAAAMLEVLAGA
jgi:hypothetical protein